MYSGYGCYDHFLEGKGEISIIVIFVVDLTSQADAIGDTYLHSWEVLAAIIKSDESKDMILDIGMYVVHVVLGMQRTMCNAEQLYYVIGL